MTMDLFNMRDLNIDFGRSKLFYVERSTCVLQQLDNMEGSEHNYTTTLVLTSKSTRESLFDDTLMCIVGACMGLISLATFGQIPYIPMIASKF